jgi:glyoxylase-like metal-dependent hydrolase (beta-lactamase superfamily II)
LGHQSVILRDGDLHYFFAGDTSFDDDQLANIDTAGIVADPSQSRETLGHIQSYCLAFNTVYLPSHDPASRDRLLSNSITAL